MNYQLDEAAALVAKELPDWTWGFTRITNPDHGRFSVLVGPGIGVTLFGPNRLQVWEKHPDSALEAVKAAIPRARARLADYGAA